MSCSTAFINSVPLSVIERLPRLHCCFQGSQSLGLPSSLHLSFLYLLPTSYTKTFISGAFERSAAFLWSRFILASSSSPSIKNLFNIAAVWPPSTKIFHLIEYMWRWQAETGKKLSENIWYPKLSKVKLLWQCPLHGKEGAEINYRWKVKIKVS